MTLAEAVEKVAAFGGAIYRQSRPSIALIVDAITRRQGFVWIRVYDHSRRFYVTKKWTPQLEDLLASDFLISKVNEHPPSSDAPPAADEAA